MIRQRAAHNGGDPEAESTVDDDDANSIEDTSPPNDAGQHIDDNLRTECEPSTEHDTCVGGQPNEGPTFNGDGDGDEAVDDEHRRSHVDEYERLVFEAAVLRCDTKSLHSRMQRDRQLRNEFAAIFGGDRVGQQRSVHEKLTNLPCLEMGIFYRYAFAKHACTSHDADVRCDVLQKYASVFPFQTDANAVAYENSVPVMRALADDVEFNDRICKFVDAHFGAGRLQHEPLVRLFIANVHAFKTRTLLDTENSRALFDDLLVVCTAQSNYDQLRQFLCTRSYLRNFPHLTPDGIKMYSHFAAAYNRLCRWFERADGDLVCTPMPRYAYLPEINCIELCLLLEVLYFRFNRDLYLRLFEKYFFFFLHAISSSSSPSSSQPHPIFFIDTTLWLCMRSYSAFTSSRDDIRDLQWELWTMTLVHRRTHPMFGSTLRNHLCVLPTRDDLTVFLQYAAQLSAADGRSSTVVFYADTRRPLPFRVCMLDDETAFTLGYSSKRGRNLRMYYETIFRCASLSSKSVARIVHYNAYRGEETVVAMPPPCQRRQILDFMRRHDQPRRQYFRDFLPVYSSMRRYFYMASAYHYEPELKYPLETMSDVFDAVALGVLDE